jgi:hypothetical protein
MKDPKPGWWVFYPVKGLDITDEEADLDQPLFGDATVISKKHIRKLVPLLRLNERGAPGHDHEADTILIIEKNTFSTDFHSFIAVLRSGSRPPTGNFEDDSKEPDLIEKKARPRAKAVAALLALAFLANSKKWLTCGTVDQFNQKTRQFSMISFDEVSTVRVFGGEGNTRLIRAREDLLSLSRQEMLRQVTFGPAEHLGRLLMSQKSDVSPSLLGAVMEAALCLTNAIHTVDPPAQILLAVTTMEILMAEQGDSFESIQSRVMCLIGPENFEKYRAEEVFRARHLYVHRAQEPASIELPNRALALALSCLCEFTRIASSFASKVDAIAYLEFLNAAERITPSGHVPGVGV